MWQTNHLQVAKNGSYELILSVVSVILERVHTLYVTLRLHFPDDLQFGSLHLVWFIAVFRLRVVVS
jgi:hypothetical protein